MTPRPLNFKSITALDRAILAVQAIPHADLGLIARHGGDLDAEERVARIVVAAYLDTTPDRVVP